MYSLDARQFTSRATTAATVAGGTISTTKLGKSSATALSEPIVATCPPALFSAMIAKGNADAYTIAWL